MWIKIPTPICIRGSSVHWFKLQNLHQAEKASDELGSSGRGSVHIHPLLPPHTKPPLQLIHLLGFTPLPGPSSILHPEQSKSISLVLCWPCCPSLACLKAFMWLFFWLADALPPCQFPDTPHDPRLTDSYPSVRCQLWRHLLWQQFLSQPQVPFYDIILFIPVLTFIAFCNLVYIFTTSPHKNSRSI